MILKNGDLRLSEAYNFVAVPAKGSLVPHSPVLDEHIIREDWKRSGQGGMVIASIADPENFSRDTMTEEYIDIHALPIKQAGNDEYRIPCEIDHLYSGAIHQIFADQYARSPAARDKKAILYAQRSYVQSGMSQRTPGWHRDRAETINAGNDGFIRPSLRIPLHTYIVSDFATACVQAVPVNNAADVFPAEGTTDEPLKSGAAVKLEPHQIALFNDYAWHKGGKAPKQQGGLRNFLCIVFVSTEPMENAIARGLYRRAPDYGDLTF